MASWIIHLRIAENLLDMIPGLDAELTAARRQAYIFLTSAEANCFVAESSRDLFRIYQQVWLNGSIPDGRSSVLN